MIYGTFQFIAPETEFTLSTGEKLCNLTTHELKELSGSVGKLYARMGRTPHYARKHRTNLQIYEQDNHQIALELQRRQMLWVMEYGGQLWHWAAKVENMKPAEGGKEIRVESWVCPIFRQGKEIYLPSYQEGRLLSVLVVQSDERIKWTKEGIATVREMPDPLGGGYDLSTLMMPPEE